MVVGPWFSQQRVSMRSCVLDAIPECTSNNTTNNYSSDEGLWQRPKRQSKNNWLFRWIFNTTNPINLFNYILWHPFHSCIIFDLQAITTCGAFVHKIRTLLLHLFHKYEGSLKWWSCARDLDLLNPKSVVLDRLCKVSSYSDQGFLFYCACVQTHTHQHTYTPWQSDRNIHADDVLQRRR